MENKTTYYAKQVSPEFQEDDLFYQWKDKQGRYNLGINDDYIAENIIIDGNKEYKGFTNSEYEKIKELGSVYYECEALFNAHSNHCYWDNFTQFVEAYFSRSNGKKYNTREIHQWKLLVEKYTEHWDEDDIMCDALKLMTGKKWRRFTIRGCMQREWQYGYASEELTDMDIRYVEMCYFNTGEEFLVFENEEDFNNDENATSYYVEDADDLNTRFDGNIRIFEFNGYLRTPQYKERQ